MSKTAAEQSKCAISHPYEREAVALLFAAGWTHSELAMTFGVSDSTIGRLLRAEEVAE